MNLLIIHPPVTNVPPQQAATTSLGPPPNTCETALRVVLSNRRRHGPGMDTALARRTLRGTVRYPFSIKHLRPLGAAIRHLTQARSH